MNKNQLLINLILSLQLSKLTKNEIKRYWLYLMQVNSLYCDICGQLINKTTGKHKLTYDHYIPKSKGGKTSYQNSSPAHSICNNLKSDYLPKVWEKIGLEVLQLHKILVNKSHTRYKYK